MCLSCQSTFPSPAKSGCAVMGMFVLEHYLCRPEGLLVPSTSSRASSSYSCAINTPAWALFPAQAVRIQWEHTKVWNALGLEQTPSSQNGHRPLEKLFHGIKTLHLIPLNSKASQLFFQHCIAGTILFQTPSPPDLIPDKCAVLLGDNTGLDPSWFPLPPFSSKSKI